MHTRFCVTMLLCSLCFVGCSRGKPIESLIEDLRSARAGDQIKAVRLLQHRQGDAAKVVPALTESLKDSHADIRCGAAIGLGYFGKEAVSALPALKGAQQDKDGRVREAARVAISRIEK